MIIEYRGLNGHGVKESILERTRDLLDDTCGERGAVEGVGQKVDNVINAMGQLLDLLAHKKLIEPLEFLEIIGDDSYTNRCATPRFLLEEEDDE